MMTANDLTTSLPLLVQDRSQLSFAREILWSERENWKKMGGQITSKGDNLLQSNLPLGDILLQGAGYFVTGRFQTEEVHEVS